MPLGMYDNIVYYHNTRKKANRKPVNFLKTQKAQELFKTSGLLYFHYSIKLWAKTMEETAKTSGRRLVQMLFYAVWVCFS